MMIEVNITGRLGNQLFQYACARQLQEMYGGTIVLNIHELSKNMPDFDLSLDDFILNENVVIEKDKPLSKVSAERFDVKLFRRFIPNIYFYLNAKRNAFIWKDARTYKELPRLNSKKENDIVLNGYWQCEKYFDDISDILRKEIKPKYLPKKDNKFLYEKISSTNSVCVTIRRGDFLNDKNKSMFYVCNEKYFEKALRRIQELVPDCIFFAFSDDIEWVKENLSFPGTVYYESGEDPVWEKLRLMSSCKHFILSNSSFSWWAQYLSEFQSKVVIAPSKWYNSGKNRKAAVYLEEWEIIDEF